jgi:branched-chain amino acid transport system permease protein
MYLTPVGRRMRAIADSAELAAASGIRAKRVMVFLWAIAGAFCGLGGALLGIKAVVLPELGWELLMPMFAGVILGGIGSPVGAVLGIVTFTIAQELASLFVGPAYKAPFAFLILLCVLLLRPQGMLGRPLAVR